MRRELILRGRTLPLSAIRPSFGRRQEHDQQQRHGQQAEHDINPASMAGGVGIVFRGHRELEVGTRRKSGQPSRVNKNLAGPCPKTSAPVLVIDSFDHEDDTPITPSLHYSITPITHEDDTEVVPPALREAVNDPGFIHIVRRHLQPHPIARRQPDKTFSHFPRDMSEHDMLVRQLHSKHRPGQHGQHFAFDLDRFPWVYSHVS